jgi:membrane-associated phospholipid phosphatase
LNALTRRFPVQFLVLFLFPLLAILPVSAQSALPDSPSFSSAAATPVAKADLLAFPAPGPSPQADPPQPSDTDYSARGLFKRGLQDQKDIYTLPLHRRNLKWTALFLAGTAGLIAADKHISGEIGTEHTNVSDTISNVGLYSMIGSVGILGLSGWKTGDSHERETAILGAEAFANSGIVLLATQLIAGRQRPLEGNHEGDFWKNNTIDSSFPSGHSTFTWTLASVVAHEYPSPWVQFLTYGTATTVSITRVTALRHFPADVAVGAVFGYFIGQHIFHSHCKPGLSPSCHGGKGR